MIRPDRRTLILAGAGALVGSAAGASEARLLSPRFAVTGNSNGPDHGAWDDILAARLRRGGDGIVRFDYSSADPGAVRDYVRALAGVDPARLTAPAAFCYWVNLYNALTVLVVLNAYPVKSIRDIGGSLFAPGPWRQPLVEVAGRRLSLDDIEHGILRPVWRDPRVHYAVNCASLGCPDLAAKAYTAGRLESMLEDGARAYVNHPRGVQIRSGRLEVSSIYRWFREDFGGTEASVIAHLRRYAEPTLARALSGQTQIAGYGYDWRLNDERS